jgi:hypothetical protein
LACTSSPSSMPMSLMFCLLMESQSSCIFLSQLLSCLTKSSSVFFYNFYFIFEIWESVFHLFSLLEWPTSVFFVWLNALYFQDFCLSLFLRFSISLFNSYFIFLPHLIHMSLFHNVLCFTLVFIKVPLSSCIHLCVFPCSLLLVSWNVLSASCTFWLTVSYSFS